MIQTEWQKFYKVGDQLKAEINVYYTNERFSGEKREAPPIDRCRYAALHIRNKTQSGKDGHGYVVYDRLLNRIVDGVYYGDQALENTLDVAQWYNDGFGIPDGSPSGIALGLIYPKGH